MLINQERFYWDAKRECKKIRPLTIGSLRNSMGFHRDSILNEGMLMKKKMDLVGSMGFFGVYNGILWDQKKWDILNKCIYIYIHTKMIQYNFKKIVVDFVHFL